MNLNIFLSVYYIMISKYLHCFLPKIYAEFKFNSVIFSTYFLLFFSLFSRTFVLTYHALFDIILNAN